MGLCGSLVVHIDLRTRAASVSGLCDSWNEYHLQRRAIYEYSHEYTNAAFRAVPHPLADVPTYEYDIASSHIPNAIR